MLKFFGCESSNTTSLSSLLFFILEFEPAISCDVPWQWHSIPVIKNEMCILHRTWISHLSHGNLAPRNKKTTNLFHTFWRKSESSAAGRTNGNSSSCLEWKSFLSRNTLPNLEIYKRPKAGNILHELLEATDLLPQKSMIMLSTDGPNTNWKVWKFKIQRYWERIFPNYWCWTV